MKRILCLILSLIMLVSLIACSFDDGNADTTTTTTTTAPTTGSTTTTTTAGAVETPYVEWDTEGYHIYVSNSGNDANDGLTPESAVESIYRANDIARDYVNGNTADKENVIISLEKGDYYMTESLRAVSGTDDVTVYYTSRGGMAQLLGGQRIMSDEIKKCEDAELLNRIRNEDARDSIYVVNLAAYEDQLTDLLASGRDKDEYGYKMSCVEFYCGDKGLSPSRWPEADYHSADSTEYGIELLEGYIPITFFNFTKNGEFLDVINAGGDFAVLPMNLMLRNEAYERVKSWDVDGEKIYISDFMTTNYTHETHYITDFVDRSYLDAMYGVTYKGYVVTHTGPSGKNHLGGANETGGSPYRRLYFFNIIEEINEPGEYYYDEENMKLYVYLDETLPKEDLHIATLNDIMFRIEGTASAPIKNVGVINLSFAYTKTGVMGIMYAEGITVQGCDIGNAAGKAMKISSSRDITVKDTKMHDLGMGAVSIKSCAWGEKDGTFDHANILFENCLIQRISKHRGTYNPAFGVSGTSGITVRKSTISDGMHAAVLFDTTANMLFEYNEFYNFMTESDDGGLFYCGSHDLTSMTGIVIRYNHIHDLGSSWQPWGTRIFYSDGYSMHFVIHDNLIYNFMSLQGKGMIFHNVYGMNINNNIIYNVGDNVNLTSTHKPNDYTSNAALNDWRAMREDTIQDGYGFKAWQKFRYYDEASGLWLDKYGFDSYRAEYYENVEDEDFAFTYNHIKWLRSDEFLYEMLRQGYAVLDELRPNSIDGTIAINDETISRFAVKISGTVQNATAGRYEGFETCDELMNWLNERLGYKGGNNKGALALPAGASLVYVDPVNGVEYTVRKLFFNLLAHESTQENWILSDIAAAKNDPNVTTDIDTLFAQNDGWSFYCMLHAFYSKEAYWGVYSNNITINVKNSIDAPNENWDSAMVKHWDNIDYVNEAIDFEVCDGNGGYDENFEGLVYDLISEYGLDFTMLDLSLVGASIK